MDTLDPDTTVQALLGHRKIVASGRTHLATTSPYTVVTTGAAFASVTPRQRHRVEIEFFASDIDRVAQSPSLRYTISLPALHGQRLGVTFEPATPADADLIENLRVQGATALPLYLLRMRLLLQIEGVTVASGPPLDMGQPSTWQVTLHDPLGIRTSSESFEAIIGDELVFGINASGMTPTQVLRRQRVSPPRPAAEDLHLSALNYWMMTDFFAQLAAQLRGIRFQRLPSVGLFAHRLRVSHAFGVPHSGVYLGREMDVKRIVAAVVAPDARTRWAFMFQTGMLSSYFEGFIFDHLFLHPQGSSVSAIQLIHDANVQGMPIYGVTAANLNTVLPQLTVSEKVEADIRHAVLAKQMVIIPERPIHHGNWEGSGYIVLDVETGSGAYLIEGGTNGSSEPECERKLTPEGANFVAFALAALLSTGILAAAKSVLGKKLVTYFVITAVTGSVTTVALIHLVILYSI